MPKLNTEDLVTLTYDVDASVEWKKYAIATDNRVIDFANDGYNQALLIKSDEDFTVRTAASLAAAAALDLDGYGTPFAGGLAPHLVLLPPNHCCLAARSIDGAAAKLYVKKLGMK